MARGNHPPVPLFIPFPEAIWGQELDLVFANTVEDYQLPLSLQPQLQHHLSIHSQHFIFKKTVQLMVVYKMIQSHLVQAALSG